MNQDIKNDIKDQVGDLVYLNQKISAILQNTMDEIEANITYLNSEQKYDVLCDSDLERVHLFLDIVNDYRHESEKKIDSIMEMLSRDE